ncbi:hypothetical protein, partial [Yersinia pseudotuberculosis]|uniref:hypothetical protein n=1 Tax=Yersinia pseudotuberculosis TaxID=633 RepID=UPI001A9F1F21
MHQMFTVRVRRCFIKHIYLTWSTADVIKHDVGFLCPENPQLGWGFSKAFSFGSVIKTPFDLLKQFAVWQ